MYSIIRINKNNKIINLYDQTLLLAGRNHLNAFPSWFPLVAFACLSAAPFDRIFFSCPTSKEQREDLKQSPSCCFLISQWSTLPFAVCVTFDRFLCLMSLDSPICKMGVVTRTSQYVLRS